MDCSTHLDHLTYYLDTIKFYVHITNQYDSKSMDVQKQLLVDLQSSGINKELIGSSCSSMIWNHVREDLA